MTDDAFTLARAQRILPLLPALYEASGKMNTVKMREVCDTIWQADQDAMGSFEEKAQMADEYPPIPQQWHDLWAAIKSEAKSTDEAIHKLGLEIAAKLDAAKAAAAKKV
jgi:hypothetical protein